MKLDHKDRKIISMYSENSDISQEEVAQAVGLSQPSVAVRIKKLKEAGAIQTMSGINPLEMGLFIAKVDISSNRPNKILNMFNDCPYFANGLSVSGKYNLCLLFMSENISTLEAIVNGHIRSNEWVTDVDFNIVISTERKLVIPTSLAPERRCSPPCGISTNCSNCDSFVKEKCMGCPVTGQYQGWLY